MNSNQNQGICVLLESYFPIIGGMETQAQLINDVFIENNIRVSVITRCIESSFTKEENMNGISIRRIPPKGYGNLKRWIMIITSLPYLLFEKRNYNIILVSGFRTLGISAILISKIFNKICILKADNTGELSGSFFLGGLKKFGFGSAPFLFRMLLKVRNSLLMKADAFISLSSEMTSEFKNYKVSDQSIYEIPNCFDPENFYPVDVAEKAKLRVKLNLPLNCRIVIFTGRLLSTKGLPLLIRVWNEILKNHENVLLLIVGTGVNLTYSCDAELKEYVLKKKIQKSVIFTGKVYNVHEYLKSSDIFCLPTENEAFGISLVEAMACGLASITTPVGGIKDIITHGYNGYLMEKGSYEQLYYYLDFLLKNDEQIIKMGENSFLTVKDKYSKYSVAGKYIDLFKELTEKKFGSYLSFKYIPK